MNGEEGGIPKGLTERFCAFTSTRDRPLSYHLRSVVWGPEGSSGSPGGSEPRASAGQVSSVTVSVFRLPCDRGPSRWG